MKFQNNVCPGGMYFKIINAPEINPTYPNTRIATVLITMFMFAFKIAREVTKNSNSMANTFCLGCIYVYFKKKYCLFMHYKFSYFKH